MIKNLEQLGSAIQHRRQILALSQAEVAEKAGISRGVFARLEGGAPGVRTENIFLVLAALGFEGGLVLELEDLDTGAPSVFD